MLTPPRRPLCLVKGASTRAYPEPCANYGTHAHFGANATRVRRTYAYAVWATFSVLDIGGLGAKTDFLANVKVNFKRHFSNNSDFKAVFTPKYGTCQNEMAILEFFDKRCQRLD